MTNPVDDRIVEMQFNNATFEQKIGETLKSLSQLQKSLDLSNAAKGLSNINVDQAVPNLHNMASAVENISSKFSALGVVAFTTISNITNKVVDAGMRFAKQFTVAPIMDGFREMETKVGSIQTILANTARHGTGLDEVTANLDELNKYSDKTIYNFGEMTKNIGLFTNAGIKVGDATSMIKGFSNAAAASGTTAEGAAGAAYQLSQALSNGAVKLMDWRSLTNVGMGNKNMQQGVLEIAKAMGTLEDTGTKAEDVTAHFNETLEKGWLTTDVMSTYLRTMAGDMDKASLKALGLSDAMADNLLAQQKTAFEAATKVRTFTQLIGTIKESIGSGWAQTIEIFTGGFEGATSLFSAINDAVGGFVGRISDARNAMLKTWADFNGRGTLIEGIVRIFQALGEILNGVKFAFRSLFPAQTASDLLRWTASFSDFSIALKAFVDRILPSLVYGFGVVFSVIRIGVNIVKGITGLFVDLFRALVPERAGTNAVGFFGNLARALYTLNVAVINGGITKFFEILSKVLVPVARLIGNAAGAIIDFFFAFKYSKLAEPVIGFISRAVHSVQSLISMLQRGITPVTAFAQAFAGLIGQGAVDVILSIVYAFRRFGDAITDVYNIFVKRDFVGAFFEEDSKIVDILFRIRDAFAKLANIVASVNYGDILKSTINLFKDLGSAIGDFFSNFGAEKGIEKASKQIGDLNEKAGLFYKTIGAKDLGGDNVFGFNDVGGFEKQSSGLKKFFQTIQDYFSSFIDSIKGLGGNLGDIFHGVKEAFLDFFAGNDVLGNKKSGFEQLMDVVNAALFASLLITMQRFISSLKDMTKSVSGVFDQLGKTLKTFQTKVKADALFKIAAAMVLLAGAVFILSTIDQEALAQSMAAMVGGFIALVGVMKLLDRLKSGSVKVAAVGAALLLISGALILMATAVKIFATMDVDELMRGLTSATIALAALAASTQLIKGNTPGMIGAAVAVVALSGALIIMAGAVKLFAAFDPKDLAQGLAAASIALLVLSKAIGQMGWTSILAGPALLITAVALVKMAEGIEAFAAIPAGSLAKGLTSIALALGIISHTIGSLPWTFLLVASGFPRFAEGLKVMAEAVEKMGSIPFGTLLKGLGGMSAMLVAIVLAVNAMNGALAGAAALVIVSGALWILADTLIRLGSTDWKKILLGIGSLTVTMLLLAAAGAFLTPFLLALGAAMLVLGAGFLLFGGGVYLAVKAFTLLASTAGENVDNIIESMQKIAAAIPGIIAIFVENLAVAAEDIVGSSKRISDSIAEIIINALDAVIKVIPKVAEVANKITDAFIQFVSNRLVDFVDMGYAVIQALSDGLLENIGSLTITGVKIMLGFMQAILDRIPDLVTAGINIIVAFAQGIARNAYKLIDAGVDIIVAFMAGIAVKAVELANAAGDTLIYFLNGLAEAIRTKAPEIRKAGSNIAFAIIEGVTAGLLDAGKLREMVDTAKEMANKVVDGFKAIIRPGSPSKTFTELAKTIPQGVALTLDKDTIAQNSAVRNAERIVSAFADTLAQMPTGLPGVDDSPVITPVLDLTKVQAASRNLDSLMRVSAITPSVSFDQARSIATATQPSSAEADGQNGSEPKEVTFIQNNYSPEALTTNQIYRNTKSQIALAKEELDIK